MRQYLRLMAAFAVCLAAYGVLLGAFRLSNTPRNAAVLGGIGVIFLLLAIVPVVLTTLWRRL